MIRIKMYPLVMADIAIEDGHRNSGCSWIFPLNMVMFHSYVSLPEGMFPSLSPENLEP